MPPRVQYSSSVDPSPYENIRLQAWAHENKVYVVLEAMWLGSLLGVMQSGEQPLFHYHPEAAGYGEVRSQAQAIAQTDKRCNRNDDDENNDNDRNNDEDNERVMLAISFQVFWGLE